MSTEINIPKNNIVFNHIYRDAKPVLGRPDIFHSKVLGQISKAQGGIICRNEKLVTLISDLAPTDQGLLSCVIKHEKLHIEQHPKDICKGQKDNYMPYLTTTPEDKEPRAVLLLANHISEKSAYETELKCLKKLPPTKGTKKTIKLVKQEINSLSDKIDEIKNKPEINIDKFNQKFGIK